MCVFLPRSKTSRLFSKYVASQQNLFHSIWYGVLAQYWCILIGARLVQYTCWILMSFQFIRIANDNPSLSVCWISEMMLDCSSKTFIRSKLKKFSRDISQCIIMDIFGRLLEIRNFRPILVNIFSLFFCGVGEFSKCFFSISSKILSNRSLNWRCAEKLTDSHNHTFDVVALEYD